MIIIEADYHPGFPQLAFVDTETGDYRELPRTRIFPQRRIRSIPRSTTRPSSRVSRSGMVKLLEASRRRWVEGGRGRG